MPFEIECMATWPSLYYATKEECKVCEYLHRYCDGHPDLKEDA